MLEYFRFKEIHDLYLTGQIEEARRQLGEIQARYVDICDENATLRAQIQGYEDILFLSRSLIFDGIFFWLITGNIKQGPFCPTCYNRDGLLLRLSDDGTSRHCLTCSSRFKRAQAPLPFIPPAARPAGHALGALAKTIPEGLAQGTHEEENSARVVGMDMPQIRKATVIPFAR